MDGAAGRGPSTPATTPARWRPTSPRRIRPRWSWPPSAPRTAAARHRSMPGGGPSTWRSASSPARPPTRPRRTSSCATRWTLRSWRWAGGRATRATASRLLRLCPPGSGRVRDRDPVARGCTLGARHGRVPARRRRRPLPAIRTRPPSSSRVRHSGTRARSAAGPPRWRPAPRARRRRSAEVGRPCGPGRCAAQRLPAGPGRSPAHALPAAASPPGGPPPAAAPHPPVAPPPAAPPLRVLT